MGQAGRVQASALLSLFAVAGCASLPKGQYGVTEVDWVGVEEVSEEAIEACLVTRERERVTFRLGLGSNKCGEPPFDSSAPKLSLWSMPWSEWPLYDPSIFDLDRERILRWYRARGFYDANVKGVRTYVDGEMLNEPVDCDSDESSCEVEVMVQVDEGKPVLVKEVKVETTTGTLSTDILRGIEKQLTIERGERFDEHDYEEDKQLILTYLWNKSYARAQVKGKVEIDREKRTARVTYLLEPGPACVFGELKVEGAPEDIPTELIILAADIRAGKEYSLEAIQDAEQAVFALGVFSSVSIKPQGEGSKVDLIANVRVGRLVRWSGGVGIMSGTQVRQTEQTSVPQWDVHLVGAWEHRNFFGGMRRLRIEERPRMIFLDEFPGAKGGPRPGNIISARFEQPQALERRTTLFIESSHDFGPDPYEGFFRHDLTAKVGLSRPFWRQRFKASVAVAHDFYDITSTEGVPDTVSSYTLPYLEQQLTLDLRNNPQRPRYGAYAAVLVQEAFRLGYGSWNYVRITPDVRGYVPLMWDFVLAARFALGALFISDRSQALDETSTRLGPWPYRLRGGGANGNRGFSAGDLGVGQEDKVGGIRRYEASLELRIPFGEDLGMVVFGDIGNVSQEASFHFEQVNTSVGFGLRYFTIIGAVRLDLGWRVPGWQTIGDEPEPEFESDGWPTAFHLTIGEAF